jgi:tetratricopeptide (TPR) repeat protein
MSKLHESLKKIEVRFPSGKLINLYDRINEIKKSAKLWLSGLDKNGYDHSERLEKYLDSLTKNLLQTKKITPDEIFLLLCATYMHDIGYMHEGNVVQAGHAKRSREMILLNPSKYHFGDFPIFDAKYPLVAIGVGYLCLGHSLELSLDEIPDDFTDQLLPNEILNLRKLTALLRLADEADDPYIRPALAKQSIRKKVPLVRIGDDTIVWHWERSEEEDPIGIQRYVDGKKRTLESTINYLDSIGVGKWYLVLDPQVTTSLPFMAEEPVETFVGRDTDLEKIHSIIMKARKGAVTGVVGTGGIGKTELVRMYAKKYRDEFTGGVFWASLKGSTWREEAVKIIAAGTPTGSPVFFPDKQHAIESVSKGVLARKDALLIIDNVNEADDIIKVSCFVLVTTRNRSVFGLMPSHSIHELPGLPDEDGKKLLAEIFGKERLEQDALGASQLVRILGGMPLAIEIAAQHLKDVPELSFPDYIGNVRDKIEELKIEGNEDKNVLSSLKLSLDQISHLENGEELNLLFESSGVCAESGFTSQTLGDAAGLNISKDKETIQKHVAKLHQRSLLEFNIKTLRYSMHPLLRQIAVKNLRTHLSRENQVKRNHLMHFLHYAEANNTNPDALIHEKDGIWQALIHAGQLEHVNGPLRQELLKHLSKPYWSMIEKNHFREAFVYLISFILINLNKIGEVNALNNLLDPLISNLQSLNLLQQGLILNSKGIVYADLGENRKAIEQYEKALEIARRIGDSQDEMNSLVNLGSAYSQIDESEQAIEHYAKALKIARRIKDFRGEENSLTGMGVVYFKLGENWKAIEQYKKALEIARRIGDFYGEENALGNMGSVYAKLGEIRKGIEYFEKALEISCQIGDIQGEWNSRYNMGFAFTKLGENLKAIEQYEKALEISRRIGNNRYEANALLTMSQTYAVLGEKDRSRQCLKDAKEVYEKLGHLSMISKIEEIEKTL